MISYNTCCNHASHVYLRARTFLLVAIAVIHGTPEPVWTDEPASAFAGAGVADASRYAHIDTCTEIDVCITCYPVCNWGLRVSHRRSCALHSATAIQSTICISELSATHQVLPFQSCICTHQHTLAHTPQPHTECCTYSGSASPSGAGNSGTKCIACAVWHRGPPLCVCVRVPSTIRSSLWSS